MPEDFVIIATLGQTDVQVVDRLTSRRYLVQKNHQRRFHEACLAREADRFCVLSLKETPALAKGGIALEYDDKERRLTAGLSATCTDDDGREIDCSGRSGPIMVCTPIIADLACEIRALVSRGQLRRMIHVLLLTTNRKGWANAGEPVAAARMVATALQAEFAIADANVTELIYLQTEDENVYESDGAGQTHLCRRGARRIDNGVADLRARYPSAVAVIEDIGGIPGVAEVVAAACRYRFTKVRFVRPTERRVEASTAAPVLISPSESLNMRRHVAYMVRHGALDAAAQLVWNEEGSRLATAEPWRRWLRNAALILNGELPDETEMPEASRITAALRGILACGPVLFGAVRVEEALRRRNWILALRETFAFYEAAESEILDRSVRKTDSSCFDWVKRRIYLRQVRADVVARLPANHLGKATLSLKDPEYFKEVEPILWDCVPAEDCESLQSFISLMEGVRPLRNAATHNPVPVQAVAEARSILMEKNLWRRNGYRFLKSPAVETLLGRLGLSCGEAARHYQELVEGILADMDQFSFCEESETTA